MLAASADVFTTRAGAVEVRGTGFDLEGRPLLERQQAAWRLFVPGGAEPVPFGPDLATVLAGRELAEKLPEGTPVPEVGQHPEPVRLPADDVRWAMGVEVERRNVGLILPHGQDWPEKALLVRSRDGLVRVVVDIGHAWRGKNDVFYGTEDDMTSAGVAPHPDAEDHGGKFSYRVPEIVAGPWAVGAEPGRLGLDAVLDRISDVEQRWEQAPAARGYPDPGETPTLATLFPDAEYEITPEFRNVQVIRYPELFGDAPLFAQLSVGVPLGGGVLAALAHGNAVRPAGRGALRGWGDRCCAAGGGHDCAHAGP